MQHLLSIPPSGEIRIDALPQGTLFGVKVDFCPKDATTIRYDVIRSIDRQLVQSERLTTLAEGAVSTELDWQKRLIDMIRQLNPHAQIVLTTHSPAVIMDGWADCVTEVSEISQ